MQATLQFAKSSSLLCREGDLALRTTVRRRSVPWITAALFLGATAAPSPAYPASPPERPAPIGLSAETAETAYVLLGNGDGDAAITRFHKAVLSKLPKTTRSIILVSPLARGMGVVPELEAKFTSDFASRRFQFLEVPQAINWTRDYLPEVIRGENGKAQLVAFRYINGALQNSEGIGLEASRKVAELLGLPLATSRIALEGGNIIVDDQRRLFLTTKTLSDNPQLDKAAIEKELQQLLHVQEVNWLPPLPGETTRHVDIFAKFVGNNTMLLSESSVPERKNALDEVARIFNAKSLNIVSVPNVEFDGLHQRVTMTYTNSLIVNRTVFVPQYANPILKGREGYAEVQRRDKAALATYKKLGFKPVGVPSHALIEFGGAVHCLTKQLAKIMP